LDFRDLLLASVFHCEPFGVFIADVTSELIDTSLDQFLKLIENEVGVVLDLVDVKPVFPIGVSKKIVFVFNKLDSLFGLDWFRFRDLLDLKKIFLDRNF